MRREPVARGPRRPARSRAGRPPRSGPADGLRDKGRRSGRVGPGDALRDQPARASLSRRGDKVAGSLVADARVAGEGAGSLRRIVKRRAKSVSWWMTISGFGLENRCRQRLGVEHVDHTGRAPSSRRTSLLSGERVAPQTEWPCATRSGVSRRPITPAAPAKKIRLMKRSSAPVSMRALKPADTC